MSIPFEAAGGGGVERGPLRARAASGRGRGSWLVAALAGWWMLALFAPAALADLPRVIVASSPATEPTPGFLEAVAIQLTGTAQVEEGPELAGATAEDRIALAEALAGEQRAALVVWIDEAGKSAQEGGALHIVAPRAGGASELVDVSLVPNENGPEIERALALKVGEVFDQRARRSVDDTDDVATDEESGAVAPDIEEVEPPAGYASPIVDLGAGVMAVGGNVGAQGELAAAVGLAWKGGKSRFELLTGWRVAQNAEVASFPGTVLTEERAAGLEGRYHRPVGAISLGAHTSFWVRRLAAYGEAVTGETGSARRYVPSVRLGPEIRWDMNPRVSLRAAGIGDVALWRRGFAIHGDRVADLGRLRLGVVGGFVASWR